eukprot:Gregarina_sp_Poly_1__1578@NODE_139_length_13109_cov_53_487809_g124_i0_p11_GENE_NODE_139_length_13109_cov_53_487809_g124_i0NODE_139_length_13109_cov_53_487809_g124_i0_p11_ORF_typecomplete_len183_score3_47zfCHY/PF05495_12/1_4e11zfCHY/PF05495_12/1_5e03zfCHY/PF05495_12/1_4e04_NODE_139_length_13109_cov_53_487809_g124_i058136361
MSVSQWLKSINSRFDKSDSSPGGGSRYKKTCSHYKSSVDLYFVCCKNWYPCLRCHSEKQTSAASTVPANLRLNCVKYCAESQRPKLMKCGKCSEEQPVAEACLKCGKSPKYACVNCCIWDNTQRVRRISGTLKFGIQSIYHCSDCGICRVGKSEKVFHCATCETCLDKSMLGKHRCLSKIFH